MKKKLLVFSMVALMVFAVAGCGCKKKEDNSANKVKANTSKNVIKDQTVGGLNLTNTALVIENGESTLTTLVTNNTKEDKKLNYFNIYVKDKNGKVMVTLVGYIGDTLAKGTSKTITSKVDKDLTKAKSIEYEIVK